MQFAMASSTYSFLKKCLVSISFVDFLWRLLLGVAVARFGSFWFRAVLGGSVGSGLFRGHSLDDASFLQEQCQADAFVFCSRFSAVAVSFLRQRSDQHAAPKGRSTIQASSEY